MSTHMRKYQPIWDALKNNSTVSITAPIENHKRIIQAVRKEKTKDSVWQLMVSEKGHKYKLLETIEDKKITFKLVDISI